MQNAPLVPDYDHNEERINYISHGLGAALALIAGILLIIKGSYLSTGQWIGLWVYAFSMILLFSASMLYHMSTAADRRYFYKKVDHTAIYYLIAGTYTPFLSIAIPTAKAQYLLIALWVIAVLGTLFKFIFINRFQKLSLVAYLVMGWLGTTGYGRYAAVLKCSIFNLSDHWWLSIHCRCIVLRFKKSKIYPRYLAHFCIDRRRITFSVYLSLRDLIISFLHFSDPERVETRRLQLFF
jgi:Predicted membrane protein, hemolysin III homolog